MGSSISSETMTETLPEAERALTMMSLERTSSFFWSSPWTLEAPARPTRLIRRALRTFEAMYLEVTWTSSAQTLPRRDPDERARCEERVQRKAHRHSGRCLTVLRADSRAALAGPSAGGRKLRAPTGKTGSPNPSDPKFGKSIDMTTKTQCRVFGQVPHLPCFRLKETQTGCYGLLVTAHHCAGCGNAQLPVLSSAAKPSMVSLCDTTRRVTALLLRAIPLRLSQLLRSLVGRLT